MLQYKLNDMERSVILKALENLFVLQGKNAENQKERLLLLLDNICNYGFGKNDILAGINNLKDSPLKDIRLSDIVESIRAKRLENSEHSHYKSECGYCAEGHIIFRNVKDLCDCLPIQRCQCPAGDKLSSNIRKWDGNPGRMVNGKKYKILRNQDVSDMTPKEAWKGSD